MSAGQLSQVKPVTLWWYRVLRLQNILYKEEITMQRRITILMKTMGLIGLVFSLLLFVEEKPLRAEEPIKIGAVLAITGWAGSMGTPEKEAITVIAEEVNRQGGILGRQIEVYFEDDQSNPTNSAIAATKLIRDKKVSCLLGSTITVFCMPIIPICECEQVPNVSLGAGHEITIPLKKWIFRIPTTDYRLSPVMLKFTVNTLGARKIALLHSTDASGMMGAKGITDTIDKYGASILITEKFDPKDTNMIPQLTKVKGAHPDAIILYTSAPPAAVIAKNLQQLGMETRVVASHGVPTWDFVKLAGKVVEGGRWIIFGPKVLYANKLPPDDSWRKNIYDPFMKGLKEKYGKTEISGWYANGHDGIRMAIEALKIAGTDNPAALRDALEKVRFQGLLGEFIYSPTDHDGLPGESMEPTMIKDGEYWPYKK
jgi:branched-chain amino acid transport system substrate-binding protein